MMWTTPPWKCLVAVMVTVALFSCVAVAMAEPPAAPKVSTFAPAEDLVGQVDAYLARLEESVANPDAYKEASEGKIARDANTMALISLALGLHDATNKYKAAAPAMVKAAQMIAAAKDFAAAKAAVDKLKKASEGKAGGELKWENVASLESLMKQVPMINTRLKKNLRRFSQKAKESAGDTAVLAVIAQGSMANVEETKKPSEAAKWYEFCAQMRDAAGALNKAIHDGDEKAADKQMKAMTTSCDDCHAIFHQEEKN